LGCKKEFNRKNEKSLLREKTDEIQCLQVFVRDIVYWRKSKKGIKVWQKIDFVPHPVLYSIKPVNTLEKMKK